ncbi:hypothetical protein TNCV_3032231 [Trichonephila clavipes]|nr:hypothetical protein TNCV_3032231 [Trichonephila clavipes]
MDKTFDVDINGRKSTISIDRVKPVFLESDSVQPPAVTETVRSDKPCIPVTRETKTRYGRTVRFTENFCVGSVIPKTSSSHRFFKGIFPTCIDNVVVNLSFQQNFCFPNTVQPNLLSTAVKPECKVTKFPVNSFPITSAPIKDLFPFLHKKNQLNVSSSPLAPLEYFDRLS